LCYAAPIQTPVERSRPMADPTNASIVEHFRTLEDPRIERTKKHLLLDILVIAVCTLLTGGEGFQDMELFGKSKVSFRSASLISPRESATAEVPRSSALPQPGEVGVSRQNARFAHHEAVSNLPGYSRR